MAESNLLRGRTSKGVLLSVMSPSDLPWWIWLLGAGGLGFLCLLIKAHSAKKDLEGFELIAVGVLGLAGVISFAIGLIRFVKWVWAS